MRLGRHSSRSRFDTRQFRWSISEKDQTTCVSADQKKKWPPMGTFGRQGTHQTMLWHHLGDPSGYRGAHLQWPLNDLPEIWSWLYFLGYQPLNWMLSYAKFFSNTSFLWRKVSFQPKNTKFLQVWSKLRCPKIKCFKTLLHFGDVLFLAYLQMYSSSNLDDLVNLVPGNLDFLGIFRWGSIPVPTWIGSSSRSALEAEKNQWFLCDFHGDLYVIFEGISMFMVIEYIESNGIFGVDLRNKVKGMGLSEHGGIPKSGPFHRENYDEQWDLGGILFSDKPICGKNKAPFLW